MATTTNGETPSPRLRRQVWRLVRAHPILCVIVLFFVVLLPLGRWGMHQARQAYIESFPTLTIPAFLGREPTRFDVVHHLEGCLVVAMPDADGESIHYRLLPEGRTDAELVELVKEELRSAYPAMTIEAIRSADFPATRYKRFQEVLLLSYPTEAVQAQAEPKTAERAIVRVDYGETSVEEAIAELKTIGEEARRAREKAVEEARPAAADQADGLRED